MELENRVQRVLVVDSDATACGFVIASVRPGEFEFCRADSMVAAIAQLDLQSFDVVVLDLDGAVDQLRAVSAAARACGAVLIATATGDDVAIATSLAMRLGARGFLAKPLLDADLVAQSLLAGLSICRQERLLNPGPGSRETEVSRLATRLSDLQQQLGQQIRSFEDSQETFYLDLSRMMTIISNIMDGIIFVDRGDAITLINPVAEELLGVKAFLALGRKMVEVAVDDNQELIVAVAEDHAKVTADETAVDQCRTIEFHHGDYDLVYIKTNTSRVVDYKGDFAGILTVLQDVTAEYKSDQLKNQYLSIVAHELRTPLTGIKTFSSLMAKGSLGPMTEMQDRAVSSIKEQSVRLEHQIDKLINLGYIDSNEYAQDPTEIEVSELVTDSVLPFEVVAQDAGVLLETEVAAGLLVKGDRADVKRALKALIENAVKFTPEGGSVTVSATENDRRVEFLVADTGIGINPRYQRRVFEKFFQIEDPLTRHHGGAGLGLFVAQGILEAHGARIEIDSELGSGARFRFYLPLIEVEMGSPDTGPVPVGGHA